MSVEAPSLLRLEKTSLREQALTALRRAITTGQLSPGTHLVETDLSDALQISRGTLREAMRQLQQEGLISAGARGRLSVRHLDTKEIKDIFDVRAALESLAASELAARSDRADAVAQLREAVAEMMASWAASNREDREDRESDSATVDPSPTRGKSPPISTVACICRTSFCPPHRGRRRTSAHPA